MNTLFLGIVVFLFLLAIFDLYVGVSNDAVNFLNSAIGSKAASFKVIMLVAAVGVFAGAAMSNGMMEIARHGIFRPEQFVFYEVMCIFLAVMITDIILLDVFNSLGMPTSTTVSMVFELLGASFVLALIKLAGNDNGLNFMDLLNTEKALSVILGIFLSVAIAFFFGALVQYISRLVFTFNYKNKLRWKAGLFGGIATTAIIYFLLIKGIKDLVFMTPDLKQWIAVNTGWIVLGCFVFFTLLMQLLHWLKVNVFKVVVLLGTFSLAMAFAGNDLVNFIGVPLAGFASYQDYMGSGATDPYAFTMESLNAPANTSAFFLLAAGAIMVFSLVMSKKARNVVKTSVDLSRQDEGDEMFGSSRVARSLVRAFLGMSNWVVSVTPLKVRRWVSKRFDASKLEMEEGAAFDLIRASVNLVLAGLLIALGTSLKLPLSTTYVTFMVAMGTSLADRAWSRESAVFRITGVLSVIGGWFITAGVAFIGAGIVVTVLFYGGPIAIVLVTLLAFVVLIRNNIRYGKKAKEESSDALFHEMLASDDKDEVWELLQKYIVKEQIDFLHFTKENFERITSGFIKDEIKPLRKADRALSSVKSDLKNTRRKETICFRRVNKDLIVEKNTWFHMGNNSCTAMMYNLRRMCEFCKEHVDNNFSPIPQKYVDEFMPIREGITELIDETVEHWEEKKFQNVEPLRERCELMKDEINDRCANLFAHIHEENQSYLAVSYVYLNTLQESREMVSVLRKMLRATNRLTQNVTE